MGFLSVLFAAIAAYLIYGTGHPVLLVLAVMTVIGCFWSYGVMHNFATNAARRRFTYTGGFYDITKSEAESVPDWIASVNMIFSVACLVLLVTGIVIAMR